MVLIKDGILKTSSLKGQKFEYQIETKMKFSKQIRLSYGQLFSPKIRLARFGHQGT